MKIAWILAAFLGFVFFFQSGDAAITGWTEPAITGADGTGTLTIQETQATSEAITTFAATTDAHSITYTLVSAVSPFDLTTAGVLTITSALDFATTSSYTLHIKALDDASTTAGSGTATITVTVVDNVAPAFATSYSPCIPDGSTADTTLITVSATDANHDTVNYALTGTVFKIDASSGLIQVNTGTTLDKTTTPSYDLVVTANDGALTSSTTVSVKIEDSCSSAVVVAVSLMVLLPAMLVYIF